MGSIGWTMLNSRIACLRLCIRQTDVLLTRASSVLLDTSQGAYEATKYNSARVLKAPEGPDHSSSWWYAAGMIVF